MRESERLSPEDWLKKYGEPKDFTSCIELLSKLSWGEKPYLERLGKLIEFADPTNPDHVNTVVHFICRIADNMKTASLYLAQLEAKVGGVPKGQAAIEGIKATRELHHCTGVDKLWRAIAIRWIVGLETLVELMKFVEHIPDDLKSQVKITASIPHN